MDEVENLRLAVFGSTYWLVLQTANWLKAEPRGQKDEAGENAASDRLQYDAVVATSKMSLWAAGLLTAVNKYDEILVRQTDRREPRIAS